MSESELRVLSSEGDEFLYFEKNSSSNCNLYNYNLSSGLNVLKTTINGDYCQLEDLVVHLDGNLTLLVSANQQISANGTTYSSVRSSTWDYYCQTCGYKVCHYFLHPKTFIVFGLDPDGNEAWKVGGSGFQESQFSLRIGSVNSTIISAKLSQPNIASQCGTRPTWQVGSSTFNSNSRMYFEIETNGTVLTTSSSGSLPLVPQVQLNSTVSLEVVDLDHSTGYRCSGNSDNGAGTNCALILRETMSGSELNRLELNFSGVWETSPLVRGTSNSAFFYSNIQTSQNFPAKLFGEYYNGSRLVIIEIDDKMNVTIHQVGTSLSYRHNVNTALLGLSSSAFYVHGGNTGFHLSAQYTPSWQGEQYVIRKFSNDSDDDHLADVVDPFPSDNTQYKDQDGDGYGDNPGGENADSCRSIFGLSWRDIIGCPDRDGDGWSDEGDDFPDEPSQWSDRDGDGYGENQSEGANLSDSFPSDGTQWNDSDGDGHGDNPFGSEGDWFPDDPTRWKDSDRDGVADEDDAFVNDANQWNDSDGDGFGDNPNGNNHDAFPLDPEEWQDSDSDGVGNNADAFPFDPSQQSDRDGDGFGDNERGTGADKFPDDSSQWSDIDGDGYGDNQTGNNSDAFITDPTQYADRDGDGHGDSLSGRLADMFPDDPTQWEDNDGDGLGDNQSGNNPDPYLGDYDNDGYNDAIDILPKYASPGDLDADGCMDDDDIFPEDPRECSDFDEDGVGDNEDSDDDNDGWADTDERRIGTDPYDASDYPIDAFEIIIPGTTISLGAWDLIGIGSGVPLVGWVAFGFSTRNKRTRRFESMLRDSNSRDELERVALRWEFALMLRLLGPHQGIRLERLRAELDDRFEKQDYSLSSVDSEIHDQTLLVEKEMAEPKIPELHATGVLGNDGYEWINEGDHAWYRVPNSGEEWQVWQSNKE